MYLKALAPIYANGVAAERGEMFSCDDPVFITALIQNNNAELCVKPDGEQRDTPDKTDAEPFDDMTKKQLVAYAESIGLKGLKTTAARAVLIAAIKEYQNAPPSFKSMLLEDINNVFMNPDEFGEPHRIKHGDNGEEKEITIVIDNDELMRRQSQKSIHDDGIFRAQVLFYCKGTEFGALPGVDSLVTLDGKRYKVYDAKDDGGIYVIILEKYASRGGL